MSAKNGDKSRFGRQRKQKIRHREKIRNLRKALLAVAPATPGVTGEATGTA